MDYAELAGLLLPDTGETVEKIMELYTMRRLPAGAKVTRIAPSPTGFIHMGSICAALVSERLAHQSGGVFYLRIEDTDRKREVQGSIPDIIDALSYFGVNFDEGEIEPGKELGCYGPYRQSKRESIYKVFVKELVRRGMAYPCFCSAGELTGIRDRQKAQKLMTGYYGDWAGCRNITMDGVRQKLAAGKPFVIRLKSPGNASGRIKYTDLIKGVIELPENIQDIVILKSDGLPTYHFAHAVDDYLMGTTHVFRGDEWLSSVPVHLQLFEVLGWKPPLYGHISPIMKMDGTSKRKFSKRKDPEFAAGWYRRQGYPGAAAVEYLLGLINSNFEDWRRKNSGEPYSSFTVTTEKMSRSGALFDINKMDDICKDYIASLVSEEVYSALAEWSLQYDTEFHDLISRHRDYTIGILSIDRGSGKSRKDFAKWSDVKPATAYFYDELFDGGSYKESLPVAVCAADASEILQAYAGMYGEDDDRTSWFDKIKELCRTMGYAPDMRSFKRNPSDFKGHVGDVSMVLRAALTGRVNTPDLYDIMQVMGRDRVMGRLKRGI